jgi:hypothetical protein
MDAIKLMVAEVRFPDGEWKRLSMAGSPKIGDLLEYDGKSYSVVHRIRECRDCVDVWKFWLGER